MCKGLATLPATCLKSAKDIKHKISFLLQKPEPQAADQKQIKEKTAPAAAANRVPTAAEVEKWKESFSSLMSSEKGVGIFTSFLKSEFSEENMAFWVACEDYRKTPPSKLATRAKQIYQQYVDADAPNEVNLDAATRKETRQNVENACASCFDEAQKMIYNLMEKDSYRRFLNSKLLQNLCQTQTIAAAQEKEKNNCDCAEERQALTNGA
ncbi:regulator of G-protein signaling 4 [Mastacembelus armatus]|uniref:Regulator of G protein signaling 4 n=1 Tax=Mastacembelus armatus TaxID=205130 RepID=A0A7N8Y236_9TELE|nr:regulator of G-protein signaling 4-like [Mastacembelus armatus]XP_026179207.1 regulator of G-protein signaling 4-like [Mastacembelus armatus]